MNKLVAIAFALATVVIVAGCRRPHLGPEAATSYRAAFAGQRDSEPARTPSFGADVARRTLAARRGEGKAAAGAGGGTTTSGAAASGAAASAAQWPGATGNISLEAK